MRRYRREVDDSLWMVEKAWLGIGDRVEVLYNMIYDLQDVVLLQVS